MKKILPFLLLSFPMVAATYLGNPSNYTGFIPSLQAGDTLLLANGTYVNRLNLNGKNGSSTDPIVILGASQSGVVFLGNACCNTVSITQCSYLVLKNFTIDGQNIIAIDAVKAEGTPGNWAHHITLEHLKIIGHGGDQQTVGISTKCTVWDWVIRRCIIEGAGTGMYLGNSTGDAPFVNGLLEGNVVKNTIGYNVQIKHENDNLRTIPNMTTSGKTVIRYNVFTKELNASTGGNARPCLLVGAYPSQGTGSNDYYEIHNNFFYQNPVEALFQGTGHINLYNNVFVNHQPGGWGVEIREHTAFQPRDVQVFHNTVVVANGTGINFYNCNTSYAQRVEANAVYAGTSIQSNTSITNANNITDTYANSTSYLNAPLQSIPVLDMFPVLNQLSGTLVPSAPYALNQNENNDFNDCPFTWTYRGAYSGSGNNPGWVLMIDTMPMGNGCSLTGLWEDPREERLFVYPNPAENMFWISGMDEVDLVCVVDVFGRCVWQGNSNPVDVQQLPSGTYLIRVEQPQNGLKQVILLNIIR